MIRTADASNEDICQLQCYLEPNCISYNFNKKETENGQHKCDLNDATYAHDSKQSGDLVENEKYVYHGAEVNIQPVNVFNFLVPTRPFFISFVGIVFCQDLRIVRQCDVSGIQRCQILLSIGHHILHSKKDPGDEVFCIKIFHLLK